MAYEPISTDLTELHHLIKNEISRAFPDLQTVEFYRDSSQDDFLTPACLLELEEFEHHGEELGTEQLCVSLRFSARLIFSREHGPDASLQLRLAAASLCHFIHNKMLHNHTSPARILSASEDHFHPDLDGRFAIWRIGWIHQQAVFGKSVWQNDGSVAIATIQSNDDEIEVPYAE